MRKIEQDIIGAIRDKRNFKSGYIKARESMYYDYPEGRRDQVLWNGDSFIVLLWDNTIVKARMDAKQLIVSSCGYNTATTCSRLNAVFAALEIPMSAVIRKGELKYTYKGALQFDNVITTNEGWQVKII